MVQRNLNFLIKDIQSNLMLSFINVFSTPNYFSKGGIGIVSRLLNLFSSLIDHNTY